MLPRSIIEVITKLQKQKSQLFIPGVSPVPVSGKVFDSEELVNGVEAVLDGCGQRGDLVSNLKENFVII